MGIFNKKSLKPVELKSTGDLFVNTLKTFSGVDRAHRAEYNIYSRFVAFRGVLDGLGTSLIVANTALALADAGLRVCVVDTSILAPVQDLYLKTDTKGDDASSVVDWFDLPFTSKNVLNKSKINGAVSVLSFTNRTIVDLLSIHDTADLVDLAFEQLDSKFDIILIDMCSEPSTIATTAMQRAHMVYQVWSNDNHTLESIDSFITNCVTLSCAMDKMRNVITSSVMEDLYTDWDVIFNKYKFRRIANVGLSMDVARSVACGKKLWGMDSESEDITEFNECIADICGKILSLDEEQKKYSPSPTKKDLFEDSDSNLAESSIIDNSQVADSNPSRVINDTVSDYLEDYETAEESGGSEPTAKGKIPGRSASNGRR